MDKGELFYLTRLALNGILDLSVTGAEYNSLCPKQELLLFVLNEELLKYR